MRRIVRLAAVLLAGCVLALLVWRIMVAAPRERQAVMTVSAERAMAMMDERSGYLIVDVRTQEEYDGGHIPDAICIPNESIGTEPIAQLPDKEQLIFVYCRSGRRSAEAATKLAVQGYTQVVDLGGIQDWPGEVVSSDAGE